MERRDILLSGLRAMLGSITPNMLAITVRYQKMPVILRVYFKVQPTEDECELVREMTTEILADFKELSDIKEEFFVAQKPECLDAWLYIQYEKE